jgi:hypothetical protein
MHFCAHLDRDSLNVYRKMINSLYTYECYDQRSFTISLTVLEMIRQKRISTAELLHCLYIS